MTITIDTLRRYFPRAMRKWDKPECAALERAVASLRLSAEQVEAVVAAHAAENNYPKRDDLMRQFRRATGSHAGTPPPLTERPQSQPTEADRRYVARARAWFWGMTREERERLIRDHKLNPLVRARVHNDIIAGCAYLAAGEPVGATSEL